MGRMTRLCILNLSDNKLVDLPLSMGFCIGLAKFGAGINLDRLEIIFFKSLLINFIKKSN